MQTKNGMGMNFNHLGAYEDNLISTCEALSLSNAPSKEPPRFLFHASAFGRLPLCILENLEAEAHIFVNELSAENIQVFQQELQNLKDSSREILAKNACATNILVGDCLGMNEKLKNHLPQSHEAFDLITANNLLHFFDGQQILYFLIQNFNMLKPGGRLFLFFQGRAPDLSLAELEKGGYGAIYVKIIHQISSLAEASAGEFLFPGLIEDSWLLKKTDTIDYLLKNKPNGLGRTNFIPGESLEKLARAIGFQVLEKKYFNPCMTSGGTVSFACTNDEKHSVGLVLTKPKDWDSSAISVENIEPNLVKGCNESLALMHNFIDNPDSIRFVAPFPWAVAPQLACGNKDCPKLGGQICSRCKVAKYCSADCQRKDWNAGHKSKCVKK